MAFRKPLPREGNIFELFNLETAVGRARVGRDAVRWQGATTLRAHAREEEQRGQRAAARLNRVRSALTQTVKAVVSANLNVHAVLPAEGSGQLRFLGSSSTGGTSPTVRGFVRFAAERLRALPALQGGGLEVRRSSPPR